MVIFVLFLLQKYTTEKVESIFKNIKDRNVTTVEEK